MRIKKLIIDNFRNYQTTNLDFSSNLIVIEGRNAAGKSNLLEALFLLSTTKSVRASRESYLIKDDSLNSRLECHFETSEGIQELVGVLEKRERRTYKLWRLNKVPKTSNQIVGTFSVVMFRPDELDMLARSSSERRNYLDNLILRTNKEGLLKINILRKLLRQRQAALELIRNGHSQDLESLNDQLQEIGSWLSHQRSVLLRELMPHINSVYRNISGQSNSLELLLINKAWQDDTLGYSVYDFINLYKKSFINFRDHEIASGRNLVGPQRDDLEIKNDDKLVKEFGSRGEWRSVVLSLKIAEINYLESKLGYRPILLLDDVLSELDTQRREKIIEIIGQQQTILTTTNRSELPMTSTVDSQSIYLKNGAVMPSSDYAKT